MKFFTAVALFAVAALAVPSHYESDADPSVGAIINSQSDNSCGAHNTQACCNDSTNNIGNSGLVQIEGVLKNVLGGTCASNSVLDVLDILDKEGSKCNMQTFCCDNNKFDNNGITLIGNCNPITVDL